MHRLAVLPLLLLLAACGPVRSTMGLVDAERALREAQDAGATEKAPYQTAMAEEFLAKAHDAQGRSTYDDSMYLAQESMGWAQKALDVALGNVPNDAPTPLPDLGPEPEPTPSEAPAAEPTPAPEATEATPAQTDAEPTPAQTDAEPTPAPEKTDDAEPTPEAAPDDPWGTGGRG